MQLHYSLPIEQKILVPKWHGTPDARVRGTEVVYGKSREEGVEVGIAVDSDEEESSLCESDGATTNVEAKIILLPASLSQVIATCVVASFTEKKSPS